LGQGKLVKDWQNGIATKQWYTAWDLMDYRNDVMHHQVNMVTRSEQQVLDRKVGKVYNELCMMPLREKDTHIIKYPMQLLLNKYFLFKTTWLSRVKAALEVTGGH
jgi:hypothetical protein